LTAHVVAFGGVGQGELAGFLGVRRQGQQQRQDQGGKVAQRRAGRYWHEEFYRSKKRMILFDRTVGGWFPILP
jgi:hypothetical protein